MTFPSQFRRWALGVCVAAATLQGAPVQWSAAAGGNDNWYEYVPTVSIFAPIDFNSARTAALGSSHLGLTGYLATVTSSAEQTFIETSFPYLIGFGNTGSAWMGASDAAVEGEWRWLDGPEAGDLTTFTDWRAGHPVTSGVYLALYIDRNFGGIDNWVAFGPTDGTFGYVVEYGDGTPDTVSAVPEPSSALLLGAGLLAVATRLKRNAASK